MTKQEAAIVMAYTGMSMLVGNDFSIFHEYIENKLGRHVWTHELALDSVIKQIREASKNDFFNLCKNLTETKGKALGKEADQHVVDEVKNAFWEFVHFDPDYQMWSGICTNCKERHESTEHLLKLSFCPHCGLKMNGVLAPGILEAES